MNKTLRLLLLIGLAAFIYASCSKDKDFLDVPDSFERNKNPFSVEAVPQEGCDTLIFFRIKGNDSIKTQFYPTDTTLKFKVGDSIILEARAKNGYTFINWVRDGNGVSDNPIYGFKLDSLDIDKSTHFVKHHYEARFGLDYALQVIPPIDSIIPAELIAAMGYYNYLYFGDNPPKIDFCFGVPIDHLLLDTILGRDLTEGYGSDFTFPKQIAYIGHNVFSFEGQHRCIAESHYYERENISSFYYYSSVEDSIFIMGHDDYFTAYFHQIWKVWIDPDFEAYDQIKYLENLTRRESVILSGKVGNNGIEEFHWGMRAESYNPPDFPYIGTAGWGGQPDIHDILIQSSDTICPYYPTFQKHIFD